MPSASLPERPHLDQLRRQAKELKEAAELRLGAPMTLAAAQLAVAREYGFASWARLKAEVESRNAQLAERVSEFLQRSLRGSAGAVRMLRAEPSLAGYDIRTAAVLGEVEAVRRFIAADRAAAVRVDSETGWPPLLYVCASRWHRLALPEPDVAVDEALRRLRERAEGMVEVARLLLDAGADVGGTSPLDAAAGRADNPAITELLLERGALPDDHTIYLAAFHANPHRPAPGIIPGLRGPASHDCLRLLLRDHRLPATSTALAAPISIDDAEGVRLLLDGGADPNHALPGELLGEAYRNEPPVPPVPAAIRLGCDTALVSLLLERGGVASGAGPDGLTPYQMALRDGRTDLAQLLSRHGAQVGSTVLDRFLAACSGGDRDSATRLLREHAELRDQNPGILLAAADRGDADAVQLMLDLGFEAATALPAAARAGSAEVVRLLIVAGANVDASALRWAVIGSGRRLGHNPRPDWPATVRALLDAGADPEQAWSGDTFPSRDVARLLVERGINVPGKAVAAMRWSLGLDR
jgi:ankyrin repeat protein